MMKSVEGILRGGKVELLHPLPDAEGQRVVVTLLPERGAVDLAGRGIGREQAGDLQGRLGAIAEDWGRPEMDVYDEL